MALTDTELATWKAFINAHDRITRQINTDLATRGLPDLTWYDALWALREVLEGRMELPPQPALPEAITTVWAGDPSGAVFVTPPNPSQLFRPTPELRERYAPKNRSR